jgi:Flp pilus assembly pilin Flp
MTFTRRGQTMVEYTIIIGIVTVVLYYMGTSIKRGVQSLVKVTADQVGNQQNSDQDFNDVQQGYMIGSNTQTQETKNKQVTELGYIPQSGNAIYAGNTAYNESSYTMTNTLTNGGFTPTN